MTTSLQKYSRYSVILLLLGALFTAVFLRCWKLEEESLWWDEYATHVYLSEESFSSCFNHIRTLDPLILPLYPLLEYYWAKWISPSILSLRYLSIGIGLLTLLALYALGKKLFDRRISLLAVWLLALSPVHIHHSQSIRMYGLFIFLALLTLWTFIRLCEEKSKGAFVLHGVAALALCWTHPFSALVMLSPAMYMLYTARRTPRFFLSWTALQAFIFLPQLLYLSRLQFWPQSTTTEWIASPSLYSLVASLFFQDISAFHWQLKGGDWAASYERFFFVVNCLYALLIILLLFVFLKDWRKNPEDSKFKGGRELLLLWLLLPPVVLFVASWAVRPCMFPRYTAHCLIPLFLCLACGAMRSKFRFMIFVYSFLLLLGMGLQWLWTQPGPQRTDWRSAAKLVHEKSSARDFILVNEFLWRDVFKYNAEKSVGFRFSQPVISADYEALIAAQAALCLSFPGHGERAVWAVISCDYFDTTRPESFEEHLHSGGLSFESWHFPAIRSVYVYKITAPEERSRLSILDFQALYRSFTDDEDSDETFLSHEEVAALGDLAVECALYGRKEEAVFLLEALSLRNSFSREFYPNLLKALREDKAVESPIAAIKELWKGYGARENGQQSYARQCFLSAAEKDPTLAIARLEAACELLAVKENGLALEALKIARKHNTNYESLTESLIKALESGEEVDEKYSALLTFRRASLSLERGEYEEARELLQKAVDRDEQLAPAHLLLAFILSLSEEQEKGDALLQQYGALSGKREDEVLAHLALIQAEHGQGLLCLQTLDHLFSLNPDSRKIYGSLYEACADAEKAFLSASSVRALWLAYDHMALGESLEAGRNLKQAVQLDPENILASLEWGLFLVEADAVDDALPLLKKAWAKDPDYGRMLPSLIDAVERGEKTGGKVAALRVFRRGILAQSLQDYDRAEALLKEARQLDPELTEAHTSLAFLLILEKKHEEAEAVLESYFAGVEAGVPGAYGLMAVVALVKGDESAALAAVREAERLDPVYAEEFGALFNALLVEKSHDALMREIAVLKEKGMDIESLLGDLIKERFPQ